MNEAVLYAINFVLTDRMSEKQRNAVEVSADRINHAKQRLLRATTAGSGGLSPEIIKFQISSANSSDEGSAVRRSFIDKSGGSALSELTYSFKAWCSTRALANQVLASANYAAQNPMLVIE